MFNDNYVLYYALFMVYAIFVIAVASACVDFLATAVLFESTPMETENGRR